MGLDQDAVSSVVGTVLILAITVTAFGGISIVVLDAVDEANAAPRADIDVLQRGSRFIILHRGGDTVSADDVDIRVQSNGTVSAYNLADHDADGQWRPGEFVCIPCIHGDAEAVEVIFRFGGSSIAASAQAPDVTPLNPPPPAPTQADLAPGEVTADVFDPGADGRFRVAVTNTGTDAGAFDVLFEVDGSPVGAPVPVASLLGGQTAIIESDPWTATAGPHTLNITVDNGDAVPESDEGNNGASIAFNVAAQSGAQAFQDNDRDGAYDLGSDIPVTVGTVNGGRWGIIIADPGDGSTPDLVLPAGNDVDVAGENLYFEAPGDVAIASNLITTGAAGGGDVELLSISGQVRIDTGITVRGDGTVAITADLDVEVGGGLLENPGGDVLLTSTTGHLRSNGTTLVGDTITVDTPSAGQGGAIHQEGLRLCQTYSTGPACDQAHVDATKPNDPRAEYTGIPTFFGTLAEGVWDL